MNGSTTQHPEPRELGRIGQKTPADQPDDVETIVPYLSIEVEDGLPATPAGLLNIAGVFERHRYHRLGRYLRACADQMITVANTTAPAAAELSPFETTMAGGPFEVMAVLASGDRHNRTEILLRSHDDVLGDLAVGSCVNFLPALSTKAEG